MKNKYYKIEKDENDIELELAISDAYLELNVTTRELTVICIFHLVVEKTLLY